MSKRIDFYKSKAKEMGLTQYKVAQMCGVSPQQIHAYWIGKSNLGNIMEDKLAKALSVKIELKEA